jgi:T5SS/PEP-CTERM-associated repeat protein
MLFTALPSRAQFTGDNQTNIIDGTAVNWPGTYHVGSNYVADAQFVLNGGSLTTGSSSFLGRQPGASNNLAVVSGSGSTWMSGFHFYVGYYGSANRLIISDGGKVTNLGDAVAGSQTYTPSYPCVSNSILITGSGSVLTNRLSLYVGDGGAYCSLVVSNGGAVFCGDRGYVGGNFGGQSNIALVTGSGSVWRCGGRMYVGDNRPGNMLIVSNGGAVFSTDGDIGFGTAPSNSVLITGSGSFWKNSGSLYIGYGLGSGAAAATNNRLTIADGGSVLASNAYVGFLARASNSLIQVSGGNLTVTNLSGTGILDVRRGRLAFDGGTIIADQLWLTNGTESLLEFNSGALHSKATLVSNTQPCVIGDAVANANFHLLGGAHSFQNGLRIRANALLSGCGTVNGSLLVDAGGAVVSDCSSLVINGNITNNGVLIVKAGSVLQSAGTVVNNGAIYLLNGGTTSFSGTFINNGTIRFSVSPQIAGLSVAGSDVVVRVPSIPTFNYFLQASATLQPPVWTNCGAAQLGTGSTLTFIEAGGATSSPKRFYRIGVQ